jgi:hypothetical protein
VQKMGSEQHHWKPKQMETAERSKCRFHARANG